MQLDVELKEDNASVCARSAHRGGSTVSVGSNGSQRRRRRTPSTTGSEDSRQSSQPSSRRGSLKTDGDKGLRDPSRRVTFTDETTLGTKALAASAAKKNISLASQSNHDSDTKLDVNAAPAPLNMSRTRPDAGSSSPPSPPNLAVTGVAGPAKPSSDARSNDQYSDYGGSDHAYSLDAFVVGDRLVPNPLQDAVGQAPEGWMDATSTPMGTDPMHGTVNTVNAFPSWFYEYDAWLKPRGSGKSSPLVLMMSLHGCACGCCGCCGCICGHNAGGGTGTRSSAVAFESEV